MYKANEVHDHVLGNRPVLCGFILFDICLSLLYLPELTLKY